MAAVIVHAGAYAIPDHEADPLREGCKKAAQEAHKALTEGKSAVDAGKMVTIDIESTIVFHLTHKKKHISQRLQLYIVYIDV